MAGASVLPPAEVLLSKRVQEMVLHGEEPPTPYVSRHDYDASEDDYSSVSPIPIIDLGILSSSKASGEEHEEELMKLKSALHSWGCFQAIGHGISSSFLDKIIQVAREFFEQPMEEKNKYSKTVVEFEGYGADPVPEEGQSLDWSDRLFLTVYPQDLQKLKLWPESPASFGRNGKEEILINPKTAWDLQLKWKFFAGKDISVTPAVANGVLYFPSWNGYLYAVNALNGDLIWKQNLGQFSMEFLRWKNSYQVTKLHIQRQPSKAIRPSGSTLWQTYTLPDNGGKLNGYSGAAIWGSSPSIDITRNLVYIGTGNLYKAPPEVLACQAKQNNQTTKPSQPDQCVGLDVNIDSMMAFDLDSGKTLGNWGI